MAFAGGSKRRVFPLQVQTAPPDAPWGLLPPKSPLHGARASRQGTAAASGADGMSGFDRMLLLRNMNVSVAVTGAEERSGGSVKSGGAGPVPAKPQAVSGADEVSAAHNLKERKQNEARRRLEVQLMTLEDYVNTPEGDARLRRQDERARMQEEELNMQRLIQWEKAQRRAEQLKKQEEDEAKIKEMYLAKRKLALEEQERVAREKEAARKQALEAKMKALKEEADRKAREEYAARIKLLAEEAQAEQDARVAAMETAQMLVEDEIAVAMRVEWLAEMERRRQIEAEALEWKLFEEKEAERQREETQRRRDAQKQQYEQDRARRMQIHKLQQDRERAAADKKRLQEQKEQQQQQQVGGDAVAGVAVATSLQRLRSQCEDAPSPVPALSLSASLQQQPEGLGRQFTARTLLTARETARLGAAGAAALSATSEQPAFVPPPPILPAPIEDLVRITETQDDGEPTKDEEPPVEGSDSQPDLPASDSDPAEAKEVETKPLEPISVPPVETPPSAEPASVDPLPVQSQTDDLASASESISVIVDPELLSLETLRCDGVTPVAEVLTVNAGSPASTAGLLPRDMIIEFGGITITTPKCLLAIAECVQRSVNQHIALVVLRPLAVEVSDVHVQRCQLWLQPRKWKGKGLLGCQLSPFKWPTASVSASAADTAASEDDSAATETTASPSSYDALVLHQVQPSSLASRLGLVDGDVLARCGELDASSDVAAVAAYLQTHWREAQQELQLTIQRWDPTTQSYAVLQLVLPVPADNEPLGCALTTYTHYYYPETATAAPSTACDECYHTTLASSLHAAALAGHVECLDALSATCSPELLDWRDDEGRSPLFYACYAQQLEAVRCLLAHQLPHSVYDPVSGADSYGDSPLHAAAASDCVGALDLLLESKFIGDVNLPNASTQATAAHVAASEPTLRVLKERYNADMLMLDNDGRMPLFYACLRQDDASVAYLSELHPEFVDYADSLGGNTPLHMAAWCGYPQIVRTLAQNLPSIALFAPNEDGLDARTLAERSGWLEIAEELGKLMGE